MLSIGSNIHVGLQAGGFTAASSAWTPADLTTALWLDASDDTTITDVAGAVEQWNDKSGNDYHVSQSTPANKPTTDARTIGTTALNVIDCDGGDFLDNLDSIASQPISVAAVYVVDDATARIVFDGNDAAARVMLKLGANVELRTGVTSLGMVASTTDPRIVAGIYDGASSSGGLDGDLTPVTGDTGTTDMTTGITVGAAYNASSGFDGGIGEIILLPSAVSEDDRQKLEGYLAWKWGLVSNLPHMHPYRWDGTLFGYGQLWTPAEITTALWLDAGDTDTITESAGRVSNWNDKSGGSHHTEQLTGALQPYYRDGTDVINGRNAMHFNASRMPNTDNIASQAFSYAWACEWSTTANGYRMWHGQTGDDPYLYSWVSKYRIAAGTELPGPTATLNPHIISGTLDNTSTTIGMDGDTTPTTGTAGTAGLSAGISIGANHSNPWYWWGYLGDFIIVDGTWSTATRQKVEGYLAWKWGTQASLEVGHPYEDAPPEV